MAERVIFEPMPPSRQHLVIGLKLQVSAEELRTHLQERAKHHQNRANEKEAELPKLRETLERIRSTKPGTSISNTNKSASYALDADEPAKDLERDIRDHKNKSLAFSFLSEHLFELPYMLDENDLTRLEILKR